MYQPLVPIAVLLGKTVERIEGCEPKSTQVRLWCTDGTAYRLLHKDDCCEVVELAEVTGDPTALVGSPLTMAEEVSSEGGEPKPHEYSESWTWTFQKLATVRGYVTLRWLGESNGYYGESVELYDFTETKHPL